MKKTLLLSSFLLQSLSLFSDSQSSIRSIFTENAGLPVGPFSQAMLVTNPQQILYISGQLPIDPVTNLLVTDIAQATRQCMQNLQEILQAADMNFNNVVKTTILVADMKDFSTVNGIYESFLTAPYPARLTFQAGALPKGGCIEIEMIAVK